MQVDDALMKELDGWRAQGRLLQFTFEQHLAESYGADLICPGSYRLNSILQVIRRQGLFSHAHIPHHFFHEPNIRQKILHSLNVKRAYVINNDLQYNQYLQLELMASAQGLQKKESIHTVVVNLSSGEVLKFPIPPHLLKAGTVPASKVRKRKCSFKKAFSNAVEHLLVMPSYADPDWTQDAWEQLAKEEQKLKKFFDTDHDRENYEIKLDELNKRLAPVLHVDILRGAILYVPLFVYRLILVELNGREKNRTLYYDPLSNLQELD